MKRREQYKHLLNLVANYFMLACETALFAYIWYCIYDPMMQAEHRFWNRGNWAVIGMYALIMYFFTRTFGGYRIGYLRITDISSVSDWQSLYASGANADLDGIGYICHSSSGVSGAFCVY